MKKVISILTAAVMLFSGIHTLAVDYGGYETEMPYTDTELYEQKGDFIYEKGTNTIVEYVGDSDEVVLPENTVIGGKIFTIREWKHVLIKKLTISKGVSFDVSMIGDSYMRDGEYIREVMYLEEVTFAEGVTEIPDNAFRYASNITKINLPSTLKTIGAYAFSGNDENPGPAIETLDIPDSVTTIGEGAFGYCRALKEVHLPESLEHIGENAFNGVHVDTLHIPDNYLDIMENIIDADNYTFNGEMTVKIFDEIGYKREWREKYFNGLTDISLGEYESDGFVIFENTLFKYIGDDEAPVLPAEVHAVLPAAFEDADIVTVTLPEGITEIPDAAFRNSSLQYIDIPATVTRIGHYAFAGTDLKELFIPKSVEELGICAAERCADLEKVTFEGAPDVIWAAPFQSNFKLKRENVIFMDDSIVIEDPASFWNFGGSPSNTESPAVKPTQTPSPEKTPVPDATTRPTADPDATLRPTATPGPDVTASPNPDLPTLTVSTAGDEIGVYLDGEAVTFPDAKPFVDENDRTQIPVRALAELLDFNVSWNGDTLTAELTKDDTVVTIKIGENQITKNGETIEIDTVAKVVNDRTYIPLRFVGEALGCNVEWEN